MKKQNKNLTIISNEKIFIEDNNFYCDNLDLKILPEGLNEYNKVEYIVRSASKKKRGYQKINLKFINVASNIFKFIYYVLKTFKKSDNSYLLVCITPFTFIAFLFLSLFKKKIFIYLFSSGHEEYRHILGSWFVWIYHIMFIIVTRNSKVIVCHERLFDKNKSSLVYISRLDEEWIKNQKEPKIDKPNFLYVGRMSTEKGIFKFIDMYEKLNLDATLSIVGNLEDQKLSNKNIKLYGYVADTQSLINIYDNHNIMILPSFTEATPYVVDESLSRKRPVIIFEDIAYIVRDKKGIFVCKRNIHSLSQTVKNIMENYLEIQRKMEKNILPTKKNMIKQISNIINN
jgi:glycosyltransferase involved in cell wall biosynthesis|tara:strand:+ start:1217 stop:2245 length:1029 start_codon:yes stop_codon:yes gene_type:complete